MIRTLKKHRSYKKNQSPLYKLRSRRKLASLFGMTIKELESLANRNDNYRVFFIGKNKDKPRQVEEPKPHLKRIHHRLFKILQRIEAPEYLHSGVKGKSYLTNAKAHVGMDRLLKLDIKKFFPSTLTWHVFDFFHNVMLCSRDVSGLLAKLSTCNGHVPTGSSLSQILAFYAHYSMFEEMNNIAINRDLNMTCYVDDITISGTRINRELLFEMRGILKRRGLTSHPDKEYVYLNAAPREITGSIVDGVGLRLPNIKHQNIYKEIKSFLLSNDNCEKLKTIERLIGKVVAAAQADAGMNMRLESLKQEKNRLQRVIGNKALTSQIQPTQ